MMPARPVSPAVATAILNGFGRSLGDSVIGLQALMLAVEAGAVARAPVLFRLPDLPAVIEELYLAACDLATVRRLPWADEKPGSPPDVAEGFRRIIDLRDFAFDPRFRGVAMIDYFLLRLGLDPRRVPSARKRNTWLASRILPRPPALAPGYVLVCPAASMAIRSMPMPVHDAVVEWLTANVGRPVLTQAALPREKTLSGLCGLVATAGLVISTDTAMVHLADAFSVPCLAFFTTHRPEWRARDYPLCRAIHLPVSGLPPALEFARGASDCGAARAAWFPDADDLAWLKIALSEAAAAFLRPYGSPAIRRASPVSSRICRPVLARSAT
jgi:hypothetical protein